MTSRRHFLAGMLASGLAPRMSWADAGAPAYLSAAGLADGRYLLCGIGAGRDIVFRMPLPGRGHAAAAHPDRPEAVVFARRPGTFAVVMNCVTGAEVARLVSPNGRHFYGHGAFSADGRWLYTTENDFEAAAGRIGVWDADNGYARVAEFASGGIGPHDIRRLPGIDTLVVANGGIETHPASGRAKLNIATMAPNLSYIEDGALRETVVLPADMHLGSIRHLAVSDTGQVAFGMQWEVVAGDRPLVGLHRRGGGIRLADSPPAQIARMQGYVGSITITADQRQVAVTSPRGGLVQFHDAVSGAFAGSVDLPDVCGVAPCGAGVIVTSGSGDLVVVDGGTDTATGHHPVMWDNHLVAV